MVQIGASTFYYPEEVADILDITYRTFQKWLNDEDARPKHIPALQPITAPNGRRMFRGEEIYKLLQTSYGVEINAEIAQKLMEDSRQKRNRMTVRTEPVPQPVEMAT